MISRPFLFHALSPLHAGTGHSLGSIDLPIARYKATQIPFLPGLSIKGVLRDALREGGEGPAPLNPVEEGAIFGPPQEMAEADAPRWAGAVTFNDARLLLLPVRSLRGTFGWATSPLLLRLAARDLGLGALPLPALAGNQRQAALPTGSLLPMKGHVFFEDIECAALQDDGRTTAWATSIGTGLFGADQAVLLAERLAVLDDETMSFLWQTATQVDARVRIDGETHVVQKGALWYEESLPAETVLVGLCTAERPRLRAANGLTPEGMLDLCIGRERSDLQFGGKSTVGRGRARLIPLANLAEVAL